MNPNKINLFRGWIVLSALFVMLLEAPEAKAQDPFTVSALSITASQQSSNMQLTAHLTLADTAGIGKIHLRIGTMPTLGDIVTLEYSFDGSAPQGTTFTRSGNQVTLTLGTYPSSQHFFYEAQVEYTSVNVITGSVLSYVTAEVYHH